MSLLKLIKLGFKYAKHIKAWKKINEPYGIELGYPKCCIKEFCDYPPVWIRFLRMKNIPIPNGRLKYDAGCIDGKYTGFIPCKKHAEQIINGNIKLEDLIKNRFPLFQPFPYHGDFEGLNEMIQNAKK